MIDKIPQYVIGIIQKLETAGFEGFVVGGCVRDILLDKEPKDWDVATNAKPEEIMKIFTDSVYENEFGTVGIKIKADPNLRMKSESTNESGVTIDVVEITTYRIESKYSDKRHPDSVKFAKTLEEDLSRRDFTVNAMALRLNFSKVRPFPSSSKALGIPQGQTLKNFEYEIIDPFIGQNDLKNKIIRAVGKANDRFNEDALRMMRAIRFAVQLDFKIEKKTFLAIKKNAKNLKFISQERIKDEFEKIILSPKPAEGIKLLYESGLLFQFIPEMEESVGFEQGFHHYHGPYRMVFDHMVASLEHCPSEKLEVRLACLFHDIGKPRTAGGKGIETTFYNHQYAGARMTREILRRLRFSRETIEKTVMLVQNHMFFYDVDQVGEAGVRRVVRRVGLENINDLIDVRIGDRLGSGVAKAVPYKLRHFKYMVEKVSHDPISVKQLKINGNDLMNELKLAPGPKIGAILDVLLAEVIDNPALNDKKQLLKRAKDLEIRDIGEIREMAKRKIEEEKQVEDKKIKGKYWVK
ncbi:MAG: HD domain-containing protein [Parcubacteria group bacterium]|jgi:poly(A) polymerase/tRNA nucleotidyltransferase (CCA-adding enzyme)